MPGPVGINVGGTYIVRPGVFSQIDASAMVPNRPGPGGIVGVIGLSDGGDPTVVLEFASYQEAAQVLRHGRALSYLKRIFSPSPDVPGASLVRFARVGATTRATLTAGGMIFTSRDYGRHTNGITVKIEGATSPWTVTIRKAADNYTRVYSNLGLALDVTAPGVGYKVIFNHTLREARVQNATAVVIGTFAYPTDAVTVLNLASYINGLIGFTATVTGDPSMPVSAMDNPVEASAPAIGITATSLPAGTGALQWILASRDPHVTAAPAVAGTQGALTAATEAPLAGGTGTGYDVVTSSDYGTALSTFFQNIEIHHLFLCDASSATQALGYQHVLDMRSINRKRWRIFYTGGIAGETADQAVTNARKLDGPTVYCWNGTADANPETGLSENLAGLGFAAQVCGMSAGTAASTPLTNKPVMALSLEVPAPQDSTIDKLLLGGVTPCAYDPVTGRAVIVQALTTWQGGANVAFRKLIGLRIQDEISRMAQRVLGDFVGESGDLLTANRIKARMGKALDGSVRSNANPEGFLTQGFKAGVATPAWENLTVSFDGLDLWNISVEAHPVGESAYILVRVALTPASIEV